MCASPAECATEPELITHLLLLYSDVTNDPILLLLNASKAARIKRLHSHPSSKWVISNPQSLSKQQPPLPTDLNPTTVITSRAGGNFGR